MTIPTFGIPERDAVASAVRDVLAANGRHLADIGKALAVSLGQSHTMNERALTSIKDKLRGKITGRRVANDKALNQIGETLIGPILGRTAANGAELDSLPVRPQVGSVPPTGGGPPFAPPQLPPGRHPPGQRPPGKHMYNLWIRCSDQTPHLCLQSDSTCNTSAEEGGLIFATAVGPLTFAEADRWLADNAWFYLQQLCDVLQPPPPLPPPHPPVQPPPSPPSAPPSPGGGPPAPSPPPSPGGPPSPGPPSPYPPPPPIGPPGPPVGPPIYPPLSPPPVGLPPLPPPPPFPPPQPPPAPPYSPPPPVSPPPQGQARCKSYVGVYNCRTMQAALTCYPITTEVASWLIAHGWERLPHEPVATLAAARRWLDTDGRALAVELCALPLF